MNFLGSLAPESAPTPIPGVAVAVTPDVLTEVDLLPEPPSMSTNGEPTGVEAHAWDIVDEWGMQSFPASDPPANW